MSLSRFSDGVNLLIDCCTGDPGTVHGGQKRTQRLPIRANRKFVSDFIAKRISKLGDQEVYCMLTCGRQNRSIFWDGACAVYLSFPPLLLSHLAFVCGEFLIS